MILKQNSKRVASKTLSDSACYSASFDKKALTKVSLRFAAGNHFSRYVVELTPEDVEALRDQFTVWLERSQAARGGLTTKEYGALKAVVNIGLDAMGGESAADLRDDNMTWFDASDLARAMSISFPAAKGLMSALDSKGLICDSGEGVNGEGPNQWYLSDSGITAAESYGF